MLSPTLRGILTFSTYFDGIAWVFWNVAGGGLLFYMFTLYTSMSAIFLA